MSKELAVGDQAPELSIPDQHGKTMTLKSFKGKQIVLVAHYGCAYYAERLKLDADGCIAAQVEDLHHAAVGMLERFPRLNVQMYLAMRREGRMSFHTVG